MSAERWRAVELVRRDHTGDPQMTDLRIAGKGTYQSAPVFIGGKPVLEVRIWVLRESDQITRDRLESLASTCASAIAKNLGGAVSERPVPERDRPKCSLCDGTDCTP